MEKIKVELGHNSYEIRVGSEVLGRAGLWLKEKGFSGKAVIITDTNVKALYGESLKRSLENARFKVTVLEVAAGEVHKTLESAARLYEQMAEAYAERSTLILALGGGVIGDLAGFVAATYMRGVPLIQVPTTLLAMVDSSIGGKTAVDHGKLKNIIGAFYQPKMVIADIDTLKTLPKEEISNGMAEVIKHAAIKDKDFFEFLTEGMGRAMILNAVVLEDLLEKNVKIKAAVVEADEKESGERAILNFGHTVGHAVEAVTDFRLKHGQAVAIGMMAAARISERLGMIQYEDIDRLEELLKLAGLPVQMPEMSREEKEKVLEVIRHDKKVQDDKIRFVLLKSIGNACLNDEVTPDLIGEVLFGWGPA